jgi:HD-GYP domain-containing protein (c-di-GMP phosphodiesterase class II)
MVESPIAVLRRFTKALSTALGMRDVSTLRHSDRVQGLANELGEVLGLDAYQLGILEVAATFHDVGKIGIRDSILMKPAQLDEDEWEVMRQHCDMGARIMAATELEGAAEAALVIRHHHEHYDGSGYPDGLAGEQIPLLSRVISIVDGYDAMAITRAYHRGRTHEAVMAVLHRETGGKYDPNLMQVFSELIEGSEYRVVDAGMPPPVHGDTGGLLREVKGRPEFS